MVLSFCEKDPSVFPPSPPLPCLFSSPSVSSSSSAERWAGACPRGPGQSLNPSSEAKRPRADHLPASWASRPSRGPLSGSELPPGRVAQGFTIPRGASSPAAPHVRLHSSPAASRSAWSQGPRARTRSEVWEAVVHQAPDHSRGSASALGSVFPCPTCPRGPGSGHAGSEHPMELVLCREKLFTVLISPRVFFPLL